MWISALMISFCPQRTEKTRVFVRKEQGTAPLSAKKSVGFLYSILKSGRLCFRFRCVIVEKEKYCRLEIRAKAKKCLFGACLLWLFFYPAAESKGGIADEKIHNFIGSGDDQLEGDYL